MFLSLTDREILGEGDKTKLEIQVSIVKSLIEASIYIIGLVNWFILKMGKIGILIANISHVECV
jgi:hypothetical protein